MKKLKAKDLVVVEKFKINGAPTTHIRPNDEVINVAIKQWKEQIALEIIKNNEMDQRDVNFLNQNLPEEEIHEKEASNADKHWFFPKEEFPNSQNKENHGISQNGKMELPESGNSLINKNYNKDLDDIYKKRIKDSNTTNVVSGDSPCPDKPEARSTQSPLGMGISEILLRKGINQYWDDAGYGEYKDLKARRKKDEEKIKNHVTGNPVSVLCRRGCRMRSDGRYYTDFSGVDSTDPTKYTWALIKGADGAQGVPGTPGVNGKTPYFHIAYANSADGRTGFSVDDSVNKLYIGQYTDYTPDDSTDPTKYSWTKIKGEQGTAGRTYFFQSNADVLLMGADKKITPSSLIVDSFYRDGNGEVAQSQKGWWKLEKSTDSGATWAILTVSQTAALDRLKINVNGLSLKAHDMLKVSLYFDQSKSKLADYQTYSVAVDVASLTQEQIVDILSDDGKFKGLYYEKDESGNTTLYISFNAMKGGVISLGGTNNGNGQLKIYDADGNQISRLGYTGYVVLNKNTGNPMVSLNTAGLRLYTDYTDAKNYQALMLGKHGLYAQDVSDDAIRLWQEGTGGGYIVKYQNDTVWIYTDNLTAMNNVTVGGTLMFYDLENQTKTSNKVKRQPVASVSADDSQVAYLFSGTGSKYGETIVHHRLGIRAKWGAPGFSTDYLYTDGQVSDIRLKENIEASETNALETVNRMKVRQFDWKERMGGWHQNIGFVADELEEIDPNLALGGGYDENGEMDIKQINSPHLLNYAIKAIQELSAKVDEQEKRIKELERRLQ